MKRIYLWVRSKTLSIAVLLALEAVLFFYWPFAVPPRTGLNFGRGEFQFLRGFSPDGKLLCSFYREWYRDSRSFGFALWDVETGELRHKLEGAFGWHTFSADGSQFVASERRRGRQSAKVWSTRTGEVRIDLGEVTDFFRGEFTADGTWLVQVASESFEADEKSSSDSEDYDMFSVHRDSYSQLPVNRGVVRVWDLDSARVRKQFDLPASRCRVEFSNDGTILITTRGSESPLLWDSFTGRKINQKVTDSFPPRGSFPFRRGRVLLSLDSEALWVGDWETGKEPFHFPNIPSLPLPGGWDDPANSPMYFQKTPSGYSYVGINPDATLVATEALDTSSLEPGPKPYYRHDVKVWDTATGEEVFHFPRCANPFFSPDGKVLALARQEHREILLWDVAARKQHQWDVPPQQRRKQFLLASAILAASFLACAWGLHWCKVRRRACPLSVVRPETPNLVPFPETVDVFGL